MKKILQHVALFMFGSLLLTGSANAQLTLGSYTVDTTYVAVSLDTPWEITWGKDNFIWLTERIGNIWRLNPQTKQRKLIYKIPGVYESSESGLLGLALHPNFPDSNFVYAAYNYRLNNTTLERLSKFTYSVQGDTIISERTLIEGIKGGSTHDGSRLIFGPDGHLYMTTGDAQDRATPQNTNSLNGKVLRFTSSGAVPADNPFDNHVWSFGHRNSQGLVFAPNGNLLNSEHGEAQDDELNLIAKGGNYGWPNIEGACNDADELDFCNTNNVEEPLFAWTPTIATAGIDIYQGAMFPDLQGKVLLTSLKDNLKVLTLNSTYDEVTSETEELTGLLGRIRDLCIGPDGAIYIATSNRDGRGTPRAQDDKIIKFTNAAVTATQVRTDASAFAVYPNPGNGHFYIRGFNSDMTILEVYQSTGALVLTRLIQSETIDLSLLSPGMYFYKIKDAQGNVMKEDKIVVDKNR